MAELTKKDLKEVFLESLEPFAESVQKDFQRIDGRLDKIEANMVTKDYLNEKLSDLRGDLVVLTRKEDRKLQQLIEILHGRKIISEGDVKNILSMEPFSQLFK